MKYTVEITETLTQTVEVEASNKDEAITKVKDDYYKEIIILNPEECNVNVDFKGIL
ncbi:MAG: DpnD/PcfM family protein [Erysipelotrichaceae bacterium]|nr:DpnD/PcfM family protein [Erysipelotrichaceae bacterium]